MRFLILVTLPIAGFSPFAPADEPAGTPPPEPPCQDAKAIPAERAAPVTIAPLGKQPPADRTLTVVRRTDGCDRPVTMRYDERK